MRLHHDAQTRIDQILEKIDLDFIIIRGVQGLFHGNTTVSRDALYAYLDTLQLDKNYPGVYSIVYAKQVSALNEEQFVQTMRRDTSVHAEGYPMFALYPEVATSSSYVITDIYPESLFMRDLGYRSSIEPKKNQAIQDAVTTDSLQVSDVVSLPNDPTKILLFILPATAVHFQLGLPHLKNN